MVLVVHSPDSVYWGVCVYVFYLGHSTVLGNGYSLASGSLTSRALQNTHVVLGFEKFEKVGYFNYNLLRSLDHSTFISCDNFMCNLLSFKKDFIYLLFDRGEGREKGKETLMCKRNIGWLPLACPQSGTWPTTQACALTGNPTSDLSLWGTCPTHGARPAMLMFSGLGHGVPRYLMKHYSGCVYESIFWDQINI